MVRRRVVCSGRRVEHLGQVPAEATVERRSVGAVNRLA